MNWYHWEDMAVQGATESACPPECCWPGKSVEDWESLEGI